MLRYTKSNREIHYYGEENGLNVFAPDNNYGISSLDDLFTKLLNVWDDTTVGPGSRPYYDNYNNPSMGQCTISALLVQEIFGGKLVQVKMSETATHTFNEIDGKYYDLASDQFIGQGIDIPYDKSFYPNEESIKSNEEVMNRLNLLKEKTVK